jgi:hypothetical protein
MKVNKFIRGNLAEKMRGADAGQPREYLKHRPLALPSPFDKARAEIEATLLPEIRTIVEATGYKLAAEDEIIYLVGKNAGVKGDWIFPRYYNRESVFDMIHEAGFQQSLELITEFLRARKDAYGWNFDNPEGPDALNEDEQAKELLEYIWWNARKNSKYDRYNADIYTDTVLLAIPKNSQLWPRELLEKAGHHADGNLSDDDVDDVDDEVRAVRKKLHAMSEGVNIRIANPQPFTPGPELEQKFKPRMMAPEPRGVM